MNITPFEYTVMQARLACAKAKRHAASPGALTAESRAAVTERDLHAEVMDYCRSQGWVFFHGLMSERTHRTEGEPDFTIVAKGKVHLVECKTRTGKLSMDQQAIAMHCQANGVTVHLVRSLDEFKQAIV